MSFVCVMCNTVFEEPNAGSALTNQPPICDDCVARLANEYVEERAAVLHAPIGRVLQEEILKEAA